MSDEVKHPLRDYEVLRKFRFLGRSYGVGDLIQLTVEEARTWEISGHLTLVAETEEVAP